MSSQDLAKNAKFGRFSLTLTGDIHLLYGLITPMENDWNPLQGCLCRQFFKLGDTQEEYF